VIGHQDDKITLKWLRRKKTYYRCNFSKSLRLGWATYIVRPYLLKKKKDLEEQYKNCTCHAKYFQCPLESCSIVTEGH
jgi:hypothetical protein